MNNTTTENNSIRRNEAMKRMIIFVLTMVTALFALAACSSDSEVDSEEIEEFEENTLQIVNLTSKLAYENAGSALQELILDGQVGRIQIGGMEIKPNSYSKDSFVKALSQGVRSDGTLYICISGGYEVEYVQYVSPYSEYVGQYPDPNEDLDSDLEWKGSKLGNVSGSKLGAFAKGKE